MKRDIVIKGYEDLNQNQKNIYNYIVNDNMTTSDIVKLKGVSRQATNYTINTLIKYGLLKRISKTIVIKGTYQPKTTLDRKKEYRLHAVSFNIDIIENSKKYFDLLKKRNKDELDNNTLCLHKEMITVYLNKDFWGNDPIESESQSLEYINRFIIMLENNYKIILKKGRQWNLRQFKGEIAKINDDIAKQHRLNKEKLQIRDDNGVLRVIADYSFKEDELETVNNENHISDMNKIHRNKKLIKEIVTNPNLMTQGELQEKVEQLVSLQEHTTVQILKLSEILNELGRKL